MVLFILGNKGRGPFGKILKIIEGILQSVFSCEMFGIPPNRPHVVGSRESRPICLSRSGLVRGLSYLLLQGQ
jgi:hypothetical protein